MKKQQQTSLNKDTVQKKSQRQWLIAVLSGAAVLLIVAAFIIFGNSEKTVIAPTESKSVGSENTEDELNLNRVASDSAEAEAVCRAAENFLDLFASCDYDALKATIHPDDMPFFNFESQSQTDFYNAIFPKISYEIDSVWEKDGVYAAKTTITSPDMADAIGNIHIKKLDETISGEKSNDNSALANEVILSVKNDTLPKKSHEIYLIVTIENGEYVPRCNEYLLNALLGGYPEAILLLSETVSEAIDTLSE